jgi:uncharacterized protein
MSMHRRFIARLAVAGLFASVPALVLANGPDQITPGVDTESILSHMSVLEHHPDILHRKLGARAYTSGNYDGAMRHFLRASRFADKASQAGVAELHFFGRGVPRDKALAYVWIDLAAERGYPRYLAMRENYWSDMSEAERERAKSIGPAIFAEYEDAVAKPRLVPLLRRGSRIVGSRVGTRGNVEITFTDHREAPMMARGVQFGDKRIWDPEQYWAWQDKVHMTPPRTSAGRVEVLELRSRKASQPAD